MLCQKHLTVPLNYQECDEESVAILPNFSSPYWHWLVVLEYLEL